MIERIISTHYRTYTVLDGIGESLRVGASFMISNYLLLKNKMVPLRFFRNDYEEYAQIKKAYFDGDMTSSVNFIIGKLSRERMQSKDYYSKLRPLTTNEILLLIRDNEEIIHGLYKIRSLVLFGSFAKKKQCFDSDIDLAGVFEEDISYEEKEKCAEGLKEFLFLKFQRFVDVQEINGFMEEKLLAGFKKYLKVF